MLNIPDYSKLKISVLGDVMLDRYLFGETERISPEAPVPVVNVKKTDERPGGAANVADEYDNRSKELLYLCVFEDAIFRRRLI